MAILYARQQKIHRYKEQPFGLCGRRQGWGDLREYHWNMFQFSSVAQSCPTLCDPMNHSTPGLLVHHQLLDFTQTRWLMSIKSVMPSSHLILCHPLLLLPPIPPSIRVFSNESTLRMRWPKLGPWIKANGSSQTGDGKSEHRHFRNQQTNWTGMGEFNSDDHYICYCGQESIRRNGVSIIVDKSLKYISWMQSQKWQNDLFDSKANHPISW